MAARRSEPAPWASELCLLGGLSGHPVLGLEEQVRTLDVLIWNMGRGGGGGFIPKALPELGRGSRAGASL